MSAPSPASGESLWGHYAGSVSRLVAFVVDLILSIAVYEIALAGVSYIAQIVTGHPVNLHKGGPVVLVIFILWEFVYFGGAWASSGRTPGMGLLGICVVKTDGTVLGSRQGWLRALTFPLGFLTLGVGFIWILVDRERRAVYDVIAGSTVVYAWDARVGRLKFLARPAGLGISGSPPPAGQLTPPAQQVTPPAQQVTPPAQQVTPPAQQVTPPAQQVTPPAQQVTPPAQQVTPPAQQVTPPAQQVTPPAQQVTPPAQQVTPPAQQVTPPAELTEIKVIETSDPQAG